MCRGFPGTTGNYLSIADSSAHNISGTELTVAVWVFPTNPGVAQKILAKWDTGPTTQYLIALNASDQIDFAIYDGTSFDACLGNTAVKRPWKHICGVKRGTGADAMRVYLDGKPDGSATSNRTIQSVSTPLIIGARTASAEPYTGFLIEAAIWDAALSPAEVRALAEGVVPLRVRPQNLRVFLPFNDYGPSGQSYDKSKSNLTATMTGAVTMVDDSHLRTNRVEDRERAFIPDLPYGKKPGSYVRATPLREDFPLTRGRYWQGTTGNYLSVPDNALWDASDALTVSAWIGPAQINNYRTIASRWLEAGSKRVWWLGFTNETGSAKIRFDTQATGGFVTTNKVLSVSPVKTFTWYHVCAVHDPVAQTNAIYIDGVREAITTGVEAAIFDTDRPVRIGGAEEFAGSGEQVFNGQITLFALYNQALTPGEVWELAQKTDPRKIRSSGLIGFWPLMDYGASGQARDYSIYNNDAAMTGTIVLGDRPVESGAVKGFPIAAGESLLGVAPYQIEALVG